MDNKTKKAVGIGLGIGALALLGIGLAKLRPSKIDPTLPPIITPPPAGTEDTDWLSKMPPLPSWYNPQVDVGCQRSKVDYSPYREDPITGELTLIQPGDPDYIDPSEYENYVVGWSTYLAKEEYLIATSSYEDGYGIVQVDVKRNTGNPWLQYGVAYDVANIKSISESNIPAYSPDQFSVNSYPTHIHINGFLPKFSITGNMTAPDAYTWVTAIAPADASWHLIKTDKGIAQGYPYKQRFPYFIYELGWENFGSFYNGNPVGGGRYYSGWTEDYTITSWVLA